MSVVPSLYDQVLGLIRQLPRADRLRLVRQVAAEENDVELEQDCLLALELGQRPEIVQQVREGKLHPAMLVTGLLKDDPTFAALTDEIYQDRQTLSTRPEVQFEDS